MGARGQGCWELAEITSPGYVREGGVWNAHLNAFRTVIGALGGQKLIMSGILRFSTGLDLAVAC
jgi:hypothetical protein